MIDIIQLSEFGEIDPDISFTFEPLYQMNDEQKASIRKTDADTDSVLIAANVISTDEARERLANDENSPYHSLEINDEIDKEDDIEEEDNTENII
ncbi:anti-CBASS protein Acb1 family protein [Photorhabdus australis]|nr:anti-CBASS Acb1 family protein [Photorhabdus australis]